MKIIEFCEISKVFGTRTVLDKMSFSVEQGEVHALLGENGAGKSTLMNILFGLLKPDSGQILFQDKKIGMVHQHFMLIENMSVLENILLARGSSQKKKLIFLNKEKENLKKDIQALGLDLDVDLDEKIKDLTVGAQQKIEIIKMLLGHNSILIFDEPTAMLTPKEIIDFEKLVHDLKVQGKTIIIITHKLSEIKKMASRCTVIRNGKFIQTVDVMKVSESQLAELMVGRAVNLLIEKEPMPTGKIVLELRHLTAEKLGPIDLQVRAGEILGIAGVDGNGQANLARVLYGLIPKKSGEYVLDNKSLPMPSPLDLNQGGVRYIPEDRQQTGLVLPFSIEENLVLHDIEKSKFSKGIILRWDKIRAHAIDLIAKFDIRPTNSKSEVKNLSGGNQQKVILARELHEIPKVVIAYQPTRGLDVGAIELIHQQLLKLRTLGVAVILISYELDELFSLSDRISVIFKGRIVAEKQGPHFDKEWVGEAMMGALQEGSRS